MDATKMPDYQLIQRANVLEVMKGLYIGHERIVSELAKCEAELEARYQDYLSMLPEINVHNMHLWANEEHDFME